ncbi:MAG: hypothetical protein NTY74_16345 [Ignavibacteriae bacterium]|nr:hypothetical protein [Ignavibacteriota bacterium]
MRKTTIVKKQTDGTNRPIKSIYLPENNPVLSKTQKDWHYLIHHIIGEKEIEGIILATPKILIDFINRDINTAVFMSQLIYWSTRSNRGFHWVYKTKQDWYNELRLKRSVLDAIVKYLKTERGWIETDNSKAKNGSPTTHYRITDKFNSEFEQFIVSTKENMQENKAEATLSMKSAPPLSEISTTPLCLKTAPPLSETNTTPVGNQQKDCSISTPPLLKTDKTSNKDFKDFTKVIVKEVPKIVPVPLLETSPIKDLGSEIEKQEQEQDLCSIPLQEPKVQISPEEIKKEEEEQKEQSKQKEETPIEKTQVHQVSEVQEQNELNNLPEHQSEEQTEELTEEEINQFELDNECIDKWAESLVSEGTLFEDDIPEFPKFIKNEIAQKMNDEITWSMAFGTVRINKLKYLQDYICIKGRFNQAERELIRTNPDNYRLSPGELDDYFSKKSTDSYMTMEHTTELDMFQKGWKYKSEWLKYLKARSDAGYDVDDEYDSVFDDDNDDDNDE